MLNILFVSKNIAYKQEIQIKTGTEIVTLLEEIRSQSEYIDTTLLKYASSINGINSELELNVNHILKYELVQLEHAITKLFEITSAINNDSLSASAIQAEAPKLSALIEQLETESFIKNKQLQDNIIVLVKDVNASTEQFNFKLSGVKAAMIRMSNGFEWVEAVQALDNAVSID